MSKSVLVLHTGGTIGMVDTPEGEAPAPAALGPHLADIVERSCGELPLAELHELDPLIDSSNATPQTWCTIADVLYRRRGDHAGFVVLHGTDTMAYTASALSSCCRLWQADRRDGLAGADLARPERRPSKPRWCAAGGRDAGACRGGLLFGETLLRGNRATKVDASGFHAFDSPRCAPLAELGVDIVVNRAIVREPAGEPTLLSGRLGQVAAVRLFPGFSASILANMCRPPLQGLIIEAYGAGNGPSDDAAFLAAIEDAVAQGIVVVIVSQCVRGAVRPGAYATGSALMRAGAVPGFDMTSEAALTKLAVLLGRGLDAPTVAGLMQEDLAGELTR